MQIITHHYLRWVWMLGLMMFLISCDRTQKISLPGYIEGKYTYVSTNYSGLLTAVHVNAGDTVKAGQALFTLEALPESADLKAAQAEVKEAADLVRLTTAKFTLKKADFDRRQYLYRKAIISKEEFDSSQSEYQQAAAQLKSDQENLSAKQAALQKASWVAQQKDVVAPISSLVFDVYYYTGEIIPAAKPVVALLDPTKLKIVFFVPEPFFRQIKLNQQIEVTCDSCQKPFAAKINYLSTKAEYTPPIIYSNEEKAKLVYRVEAIPLMPNAISELHSGQPVSITVSIHKS